MVPGAQGPGRGDRDLPGLSRPAGRGRARLDARGGARPARPAPARIVASFGDQPFEVPRILRFLPGADLLSPPEAYPERPQVMVTFDAASIDRLGLLEPNAAAADELIVLDHHASNTRFGTVNLVDPDAAATAVLAFDLIGADRREDLTRDIALGLYAGLVTDTGSFKYPTTSPRVHRAGRAAAADRHRARRRSRTSCGTAARSVSSACSRPRSAGRGSSRMPRPATGWCGPR